MRFMVVEHFRGGDALPVYQRFRAVGRLAPPGLTYIESWVSDDLTRCFQIMECDDQSLLQQWIDSWSDLIDFEVYPIISSAEATARVLTPPA